MCGYYFNSSLFKLIIVEILKNSMVSNGVSQSCYCIEGLSLRTNFTVFKGCTNKNGVLTRTR